MTVTRRRPAWRDAGLDFTALTSTSMLVVTVIYGALLAWSQRAGIFGLLLTFLLVLSLWRYAYALLRAVAYGKRDLPVPDVETLHPVGEIRLVLHFLLFALPTYFFLVTVPLIDTSPLAEAIRWLGLAALLVTFPASAALVGISGNLAAGVDPTAIGSLIGTIGRRYVTLLAAGAALIMLLVVAIALPVRGAALGSILANCVSVWSFLALFALIGAAVGEYRAELDLPGDAELREHSRERELERNRLAVLDRAYASLRSGFAAQGYRTIKELITAEDDSPAIYQWLLNHMLAWEDRSYALALAGRFAERLLELQRPQEALEIAEQCRRVGTAFPLPAASAATLAEYARSVGHHGIADELIEQQRPPE